MNQIKPKIALYEQKSTYNAYYYSLYQEYLYKEYLL